MPAIIENERAPILMRPFARVFMLVKRCAVETRERPVVARKMRRHPVHQHADARLVKRVDKILKIVRRAEAAGRGVKAGDLVAPRRVKRVLRQRQELDMRESQFPQVINQRRGQFAVTEGFGDRFLPP